MYVCIRGLAPARFVALVLLYITPYLKNGAPRHHQSKKSLQFTKDNECTF